MIEDFFLKEMERAEVLPNGVEMLGKELVRLYRQNQVTLASITALYVKTFNELDDLKRAYGESQIARK